ncbi:MAG: glycerol-3-phosphate 1-O-acyltransferase PlsY [Brevinema sp.]
MSDNILMSGFLFIILGFLSGSVPYGLVYSALRGVDIRKVGSGNIGATNVTRQFGFWKGFVPVAILDMAKGLLPIVLFRFFVSPDQDFLLFDTMEIFIGIVAVLGHVFSPFLKFKGGKGVATTGGVMFAWNYPMALICLGIFTLVFFTFGKKIVGRASIVTAFCLPIIVYLLPATSLPLQIASTLLGILIIFAHKQNIQDWILGEDLRKKLKAQEQK